MLDLVKQSYLKNLSLVGENESYSVGLCWICYSLDQLKSQMKNFLHPKELSYFTALGYEKRQHSYLLSRLAMKQALLRCGIKALLTDIWIEPGFFQFPIVHLPQNEKFLVSVSHSDNYCVAIAYPESCPMAIDLEKVDIEKKSAIESQLTIDEINLIKSFPASTSDRIYILFWTIKEALSKILRTGLTSPFSIFEINKLQQFDNYWMSEYKNFMQYHAISFQIENYICSISYPKQLQININFESVQTWFNTI